MVCGTYRAIGKTHSDQLQEGAIPKLSSMNRCCQQNHRVSTSTGLLSYTTQIMMSRYQICINDDRNLYLWKETWKEDTVADFLTRLSDSTIPRLDRQRIHLSFDGVRLGETTTMREVSAWPSWFPQVPSNKSSSV
jgi:hypothetical protein